MYYSQMQDNLSFFHSWSDSKQLNLLNDLLPAELLFEGEFGSEIVTFLPFIYNLHVNGLMRNRNITTYPGMRPYYYFLKSKQINHAVGDRNFVSVENRWWPHSDERYRVKLEGEIYPNYQRKIRLQRKPLIFLQNKYCTEWGEEPINYIPLPVLEEIFEYTKDSHMIVYSRQGLAFHQDNLGIGLDHNTEFKFQDEAICDRYQHVKILEQTRNLRSYNSKKLHQINKASLLIGVQGGSTYPWAYFNKRALILHRRGNEGEFSYEKGVFKFLSPVPLQLEVCNEPQQLLRRFLKLIDGT